MYSFSASTRGRTAKPAHYSIPTTASDSLIFLPRHRPPRTVLTSPHSLAKSVLKQALFATSASPSLPLTIYRRGRARLHEAHIKNLELIRDTCTSIATLELLLTFPLECANYALDDSPIAAEALDLLDTRFKAIPSLKEIIVNIYVYGEEDLSEDLMKEMRDCGWTVEVTKLPKKVWICHEAGLEFDNKEDYEEYMNHELLLDLQREQEKEEEWWREEYYRRRRDPYWKNDSDYD